MSRIEAYEGTPLKLKKTLYTKQLTKKGPVLTAVRGPLKVGDELVVRVARIAESREMQAALAKARSELASNRTNTG